MIDLIYKDVKSNLYKIDEYGNIFSNYLKDFLKPSKDKDGYLKIVLSNGARKDKTYVRIATLVAYSFIGPPSIEMKDPTINHIDGDILNNHYSNLEWLERGQNSSIRQNKGRGENNNQAILNWTLVTEIREKYKNNYGSYSKLAQEYGVSNSCIAAIIQNKNWKI